MTPAPGSTSRGWRRHLLELVRRIDHPLLAAVIVVSIAAGLVDGEIDERSGDWSALIVAGDMFIDRDAVPHPIAVEEGGGYDGQFFYRLALDPWTPERHEMGGTLDTPAWRHQRILYPLVAWFVSLGQPRHVPEALILVNLLGLGWIALAGGVIAQKFGLHAVWGVIPAFYPGFFLTLVRNTAEIVAVACVIGAIAALTMREKGPRWMSLAATMMLSLAVLARETTVLVVVAVCATWVWCLVRRRAPLVSWHHGVIPLVVLAAWHVTLYLRWDVFPLFAGSGNLGAPFAGIIAFVRVIADREDHWESVWMIELWFIAALVLVTLVALWSSRAATYVKTAWFFYLGLALVLTRTIWVEDWSFMRALSELHLMAAIIILGSPRWIRLIGVIVWLAFARWMFVEVDDIR